MTMTMMMQSVGRRCAMMTTRRMMATSGGGGFSSARLVLPSTAAPSDPRSIQNPPRLRTHQQQLVYHHTDHQFRWSSSCVVSSSSSNVVTNNDDHDEEEEEIEEKGITNSNSTTATTNSNSSNNNNNNNNTERTMTMPRLQALRERLHQDLSAGRHDNNKNNNVPSLRLPDKKKKTNESSNRPVPEEDRPPAADVVVVDRSDTTTNTVATKSSSQEAVSRQQHEPQQDEEEQGETDRISPATTTTTTTAQQEQPEEDPNTVLIDRFGRRHTYLRLSLTERCNLRCTYCMPEQGLSEELPPYLLNANQLFQIASYFHDRGVTKFRLTGGEPTLRHDLVEIIAGLRSLPNVTTIGMTTNGVALNERKLNDLQQAGLSHLNLSLDTLDPDQFAKITRRPYFAKVYKTLEVAVQQYPNLSVKLNCVIQRHVNVEQVIPLVKLLRQFPTLQIRFIEYMPFADNAWSYDQCVPYGELLNVLQQDESIDLQPINSDDPHDTTKWYTETNTGGRVGFITSMSSHFCASCNRLRVTADGLLKVCLFDTEARTVDLRQALLDDIPLDQVVGPAVRRKHRALGGHGNPVSLGQSSAQNRPMTRIGG
jgi:molybdenum cofactor biosynthesis protein A